MQVTANSTVATLRFINIAGFEFPLFRARKLVISELTSR